MDAEFIAFLDKKFQKVSQEIQGVRSGLTVDIKAFRDEFDERVGHMEQSLESLTRSVDRFVKLHEELKTEQVSLRADIDRIKSVIKEKLGVQL